MGNKGARKELKAEMATAIEQFCDFFGAEPPGFVAKWKNSAAAYGEDVQNSSCFSSIFSSCASTQGKVAEIVPIDNIGLPEPETVLKEGLVEIGLVEPEEEEGEGGDEEEGGEEEKGVGKEEEGTDDNVEEITAAKDVKVDVGRKDSGGKVGGSAKKKKSEKPAGQQVPPPGILPPVNPTQRGSDSLPMESQVIPGTVGNMV